MKTDKFGKKTEKYGKKRRQRPSHHKTMTTLRKAKKHAISQAATRFGMMLEKNMSKNAHNRHLEATNNALAAINTAIEAQQDLKKYIAEERVRLMTQRTK